MCVCVPYEWYVHVFPPPGAPRLTCQFGHVVKKSRDIFVFYYYRYYIFYFFTMFPKPPPPRNYYLQYTWLPVIRFYINIYIYTYTTSFWFANCRLLWSFAEFIAAVECRENAYVMTKTIFIVLRFSGEIHCFW